TLTLEEVLSLPWRAETSNSRSRRKTSVLRPMISARTARIDDNLGRGTDGSIPLPSSSGLTLGAIRPFDVAAYIGAGRQAAARGRADVVRLADHRPGAAHQPGRGRARTEACGE